MNFPKPGELNELPVHLDMAIPAEWEDRNGHVNVQFYQALYELGAWVVLEDIGFDEAWFEQQQVSMFDLEHHLHYRAELKVGERTLAYNRVLARSEKCFHGMYFIVNETSGRLAATLEYITACVDMNSRRISVFPEELDRGLDRLLEQHLGLSWVAPTCGLMSP